MATIAKQLAEIWFLYGIGIFTIAARVFCRTELVGWRGYQPDDYLVIIVAVSHLSTELGGFSLTISVPVDEHSNLRPYLHCFRQRSTYLGSQPR